MKIILDTNQLIKKNEIYQNTDNEMIVVKDIDLVKKTIKIRKVEPKQKRNKITLKVDKIYKNNLGQLLKVLYMKPDNIKFYNISDVCNMWLTPENLKRFGKIVEQIN